MTETDLSQTEQAELIAVAHALADAARGATLAHFRQADLTADGLRRMRALTR